MSDLALKVIPLAACFVFRSVRERAPALEGPMKRMQRRRCSIVQPTTAAVVGAVCGVVVAFLPAVARAASAGDSHSCVLLEGGLIKVRPWFRKTPRRGEGGSPMIHMYDTEPGQRR